MSDVNAKPIDVAIVGGGSAAIAAAFELTRPEQKGRYRVTVYQVGWRLGGKGASGRGPAGRIEEHGLHLWMGFYENAFRLTRECYRELGRPPGSCAVVDWQDAFYPAPHAGLADHSASGDWSIWTALLPPGGGLPGDPGRKPQRWTVADYVVRSLSLIGALLERLTPAAPQITAQGARLASVLEGSPEAIVGRMMETLGQLGPLASAAGVLEATRLLQVLLGTLPLDPTGSMRIAYDSIQEFYRAIESAARQQLRALTSANDELRRVWEIADILLAVVRGSLSEGLLIAPNGFDAIDGEDCRGWLRKHGASEESLNGAFVRGLHDLALAYEGGNPKRMEFSAGQGLRGSFRAFFNYRGSFFWKMRAGMGDVVFAPFYEVLKRRGVRFEFFHRLRNVRLAPRSRLEPGTLPHVDALEFDVQADTVGGRPYEPLVDVRGLPCWPSQPDWRQIVDGRNLSKRGVDFESHWDERRVRRKTLRVTADFDFVILGVGGGAVPHVCRELVARDPRWQAMVGHLKTVPTQAFQIWMNQDMKALGWNGPPLSSLSAFVQPFGTWADMTQLVPFENWSDPPRSIAYFCGVLEPGRSLETARQRMRVRRAAVRFLNHDIAKLWPRSERAPGEFRWELLVDPAGTPNGPGGLRAKEDRFGSQFWTANVNPSDQYVQSSPGSATARISPLEQQFDNLTVAGDWTNTGLNIGCVEAAFMSGRLAAHALSRFPALEDIAGFDHP